MKWRARPTLRCTRSGEACGMAKNKLRRIAVTVIEETQGAYRWRLVELEEDGWQVLSQQSRTLKSYKAAMAAGLRELQQMIPDLERGPREAEDADKGEQDDEAKPKNRSGAASFGFGFGMPEG